MVYIDKSLPILMIREDKVDSKPTREDMPYDVVEKPAHYNTGKYEHKAVAENWGMSAYIYCATKYILRAPHKGKRLEDLRKGRWYLREVNKNPLLAVCQFGYWQTNNKPRPMYPRIFVVDDVAEDWAKGDDTYRAIFVCIGDAILHAPSEFHMIRLLTQATDLLQKKIDDAELAERNG